MSTVPAKPSGNGYIYVNDTELDMSASALTERAAQTIFWSELFRGAAVTLAYIFKVKKYTYIHKMIM